MQEPLEKNIFDFKKKFLNFSSRQLTFHLIGLGHVLQEWYFLKSGGVTDI
jgi:hypothetical protein